MPFELTENCVGDFWYGALVPPWDSGDPPTHEGIDIQKIKTWLAISDVQLPDGIPPAPALSRILWLTPPGPIPTWLWLPQYAGATTYVRLGDPDLELFYVVLAVDVWFEDGAPAVGEAWCVVANLAG